MGRKAGPAQARTEQTTRYCKLITRVCVKCLFLALSAAIQPVVKSNQGSCKEGLLESTTSKAYLATRARATRVIVWSGLKFAHYTLLKVAVGTVISKIENTFEHVKSVINLQ